MRMPPLLPLATAAVCLWYSCATLVAATPSEHAVEQFKRWLIRHNVSTLETTLHWPVEVPGHGRSAVLRRAVAPGEPLCSVDPVLLMSTLLFDSNLRLSRLVPTLNYWSEHVRLALVLLSEIEKGNYSFWAPYIAILPKRPLPKLSEVELLEFQDEGVVRHFTEERLARSDEFHRVRAYMDDLGGYSQSVFSLDMFEWAYNIIKSRSFTVWGERRLETFALAPVCDLLNHNSKGNFITTPLLSNRPVPNPWLLNRRVEVLSLENMNKGDEAFDNYHWEGANSLTMFSQYGFVEANAIRESFIVENRDLHESLNEAELAAWCKTAERDLQNCLALFKTSLEAMPTTMEHDLDLLKQDGLATPALLYRISRKRVLKKHIAALEKLLK